MFDKVKLESEIIKTKEEAGKILAQIDTAEKDSEEQSRLYDLYQNLVNKMSHLNHQLILLELS